MRTELSNIERIKGGGQKMVYTAKHLIHGDVVLKEINTTLDALDRTKREIIAVEILGSRNVPKILAHNCEEDQPNPIWLVEQRISGSNLRELLLSGRRFTTPEVVSLLTTLLDIAVQSEQHGLVHRDIKPENIMLDHNGEFWLLDFGIVRHLTLESITATNSPFGLFTVGYASSEQFRNLKSDIDIRSDLFSIGVVCYELIQGENFYLKDSNNDVMRVLKKLESSAIPRSRINGDPQFLLSAFIGLLGDHRRFRRPRTAVEAREILDSIIPTLNI